MDKLFPHDIDIFLYSNSPQHQPKPLLSNPSLHSPLSKPPDHKIPTSSYAGTHSNSRPYRKNSKSLREKAASKGSKGSKRGGSIIEKDRKERNRIAAKQSRDRKKLYIELMEKEQRKLENEIEEVEGEIQKTKVKINDFYQENKYASGFSALNQLEGKLERLLLQDISETIEEEINIILDSIMFRVGATGKERIVKINECFKQIINLSLPALHRYVLWMASQKKHLFEEENEGEKKGEFDVEMMKIGQNNEQSKELLMKVQPLIEEKKEALLNLINRLREIKKRIYNQSKSLEDDVVSLRQTLSAVQAATFTLNISKNKFRKEINFLQMAERCMGQKIEEEGVKEEI